MQYHQNCSAFQKNLNRFGERFGQNFNFWYEMKTVARQNTITHNYPSININSSGAFARKWVLWWWNIVVDCRKNSCHFYFIDFSVFNPDLCSNFQPRFGHTSLPHIPYHISYPKCHMSWINSRKRWQKRIYSNMIFLWMWRQHHHY